MPRNKVQAIREHTPTILDDVEDPKHRLDLVVYRVVKRLSGKDPVLEALFANVSQPLAEFLNECLGPEPARTVPVRRKRKRRPLRRQLELEP